MDWSTQLIWTFRATAKFPQIGQFKGRPSIPQENLEPGGFLRFKSFKACVERRDCGATKSVMGSSVDIMTYHDQIPAYHSSTVCYINFKTGSVTSNREIKNQTAFRRRLAGFSTLRSNISAVAREQQWTLSLSLLVEMALQGISFSRIGCNAALITRKTAVRDAADSTP